MTPPDSGGWFCGCGTPISGAQMGCARWPGCVQKPDSGEREVMCPICERPLCRTTLGDSTDHEQRARCYRRGFARLQDELAWRADEVRLPLPLAQRILAALESVAVATPNLTWSDLASELRAAVERKP